MKLRIMENIQKSTTIGRNYGNRSSKLTILRLIDTVIQEPLLGVHNRDPAAMAI
ncbi:MAG: hypothetical protein V6010_02900 [Candidatus Dasytiphilus stammeri]